MFVSKKKYDALRAEFTTVSIKLLNAEWELEQLQVKKPAKKSVAKKTTVKKPVKKASK